MQKPVYKGKTYYFQRPAPHNDIIAVEDEEAWLYYRSPQFKFQLIGVSDGKTYDKVLKEELDKVKTDMAVKRRIVDNIKNKLSTINSEMDNLVDAGEMAQKVKEQEELIDKKTEAEKELNAYQEEAQKKAWEEELKQAKGNIEAPPNKDYVFVDKSDGPNYGKEYKNDAHKLLGQFQKL